MGLTISLNIMFDIFCYDEFSWRFGLVMCLLLNPTGPLIIWI